MTKEQRMIALFARTVAAQIEAMGMVAENEASVAMGNGVQYRDDSFDGLIIKYELRPDIVQNYLIQG